MGAAEIAYLSLICSLSGVGVMGQYLQPFVGARRWCLGPRRKAIDKKTSLAENVSMVQVAACCDR